MSYQITTNSLPEMAEVFKDIMITYTQDRTEIIMDFLALLDALQLDISGLDGGEESIKDMPSYVMWHKRCERAAESLLFNDKQEEQ